MAKTGISSLAVMMTLDSAGVTAGISKVEKDLQRMRANLARTASEDWGGKTSVAQMTSEMALQQRFGRYKAEGEAEYRQALMRDMGAKIDPREMGYFQTTAQHIREATAASDQWEFRLKRAAGLGLRFAVGIEAASAAAKILSGDLQGAVDQIKSLPFGIGHVAQSLEDIIGLATGWTKEIERNKRLVESMAVAYEAIRKASEASSRFARDEADYRRNMAKADAMQDLEGISRKRAEVDAREEANIRAAEARKQAAEKPITDQLKALRDEEAKLRREQATAGKVTAEKEARRKLGLPGGQAAPWIDEQVKDIEGKMRVLEAQLAKISTDSATTMRDIRRTATNDRIRLEQEENDRLSDNQRLAADEDKMRRDQELREKMDAQEALKRQQAQLDIDLARARGDSRKADLLAVQERFRQELAGARSVEEAKLLARRQTLAEEAIAERQRDVVARQVQNRWEVMGRGGVGGGDARPVRVQLMDRVERHLDAIEKRLAGGVPARMGP